MKRELRGIAMFLTLSLGALGLWLWSSYTYWSCKQTAAGGAIQETCVGRLSHPHRETGAALMIGSAIFFVGMLVVPRLRSS